MIRSIYSGSETGNVEAGMLGYAGNTLADVKGKFASKEELCELKHIPDETEERRFVCGDKQGDVKPFAYFMPMVSNENAANWRKFNEEGIYVAWNASKTVCEKQENGDVDWLSKTVYLTERPKARYVPFTNYTELAMAAKEHNKHYEVLACTGVWLKERRSGNRYMVTSIGGTMMDVVVLGRKRYTIASLFETHTFLDDTPCGKQVTDR